MFCLIISLLIVFGKMTCSSVSREFTKQSVYGPELLKSRRIFHEIKNIEEDVIEFSFVARLWLKLNAPYPDGTVAHVCTGTIIGKYWMLSAAHCLYKENTKSKDRRDGDISFSGSFATVGYAYFHESLPKIYLDVAHVHPDFVINDLSDDIMWVKTKQNLMAGNRASVAPLGLLHEVPPYGTQVHFLGWGATDLENKDLASVLKVGAQYVETPNYCDVAVWGMGSNITVKQDKIICTADLHYNSSYVRSGDAGGPLVWNDKLVGVMSFFGDRGGVTAFAKVAHYRDWIISIIQGESPNTFEYPIVNATISEYPYMARLSLFTDRRDLKKPHIVCNGVVFTSHGILTAAHCLHRLKKNTFNMDFVLSESFATVGFDVYHEFLPEHKLRSYRVYPKFNQQTSDGNIAVVFTLSNLFKNNLVKPAILGTIADIAYNNALIPAYNTIIESIIPGEFVKDKNGEPARYLQRSLCINIPLDVCQAVSPTLLRKLKNTNLKCIRTTYPFKDSAGSPLIQNGVVIGIVTFDLTDTYSEVNMLVTEIGDWLYSVLWPNRVVPPLQKSCRDNRAILVRDRKDYFKNIDHLWNLNWVVPVCGDERLNFNWTDAKHIVKITFEGKSLTLRSKIQAIYVSTGADRHQSDVSRYNVKYYRVHPDFNQKTLAADIALFFLEWVSGPKSVDYVTLGTESDLRNEDIETFWGWGLKDAAYNYYNILRKLPYNIGLQKNCEWPMTNQDIEWNETSKMCIVNIASLSSYKGDVGGPVIHKNMTLIGVVSIYDDSPASGIAVVTKIPPYVDWINSVINGKSRLPKNCSKVLELMDRDQDNALLSLDYKHDLKWRIPECATHSYLAKISLLTTDKHNYIYCTGAIIRDHWVVGSASCPFGNYYQGELVITQSYIQVGQVDFKRHQIRNIIKHKKYKVTDNNHDLSLYRTYDSLVNPKSFTRVIPIIKEIVKHRQYINQDGVVYAWRHVKRNDNPKATEILKFGVTFSEDMTECKESVHGRGDHHLHDGTSICAWINGNHVHNIDYDLVVFNNTLVGTVCWLSQDTNKLLATDVFAYLDWIESTIINRG